MEFSLKPKGNTGTAKHMQVSFGINPAKHFRFLVITGFFVLVLLAGFHMYFFRQIKSSALFDSSQTEGEKAQKIDESKLRSVLERYTEKQKVRETATTLVPPVSDPSK